MPRTRNEKLLAALKERFQIALKEAGLTQEEWRAHYYQVSRVHLSQVFNGKKVLKGPLKAAINRFIKEYSPRKKK